MKEKMYTDYCTCFYYEREKVIIWDEIKDKPIKEIPVADKEAAREIMNNWKAKAPAGMICQLI